MFPGMDIKTSIPSGMDALSNAQTYTPTSSKGVYWVGQDGNVWFKRGGVTTNMGKYQSGGAGNFSSANGSMMATRIDDPNPQGGGQTLAATDTNSSFGGGGGGSSAPVKKLDSEQLASLDSLLGSFETIRDRAEKKARIKRNTSLQEKEDEREREEGKYESGKVSTLQDFAEAKTDTDVNTRNTLENLISSLSTLGLGGSRALTRQILDAANMSNRKANATQAKNSQELDASWNEFDIANEQDVDKINDQFGYDVGEAERSYLQDKQDTLYKKADVYNAVDDTSGRSKYMKKARGLDKMISEADFINPAYTGEARAIETPELANYTQDIAKYDTTAISGADAGVTPVTAGNTPGNIAVKAIAVNDKDLGIKKKNESDKGYGL